MIVIYLSPSLLYSHDIYNVHIVVFMLVFLLPHTQSPEIRKYKRKFNGEILCGALWGVNLLVGTDNGLLLLDRSGHGKGELYLENYYLWYVQISVKIN